MRNQFVEIQEEMPSVGTSVYEAALRKWDAIAKPLGSLGAFEDMVAEAAEKCGYDPVKDGFVLKHQKDRVWCKN